MTEATTVYAQQRIAALESTIREVVADLHAIPTDATAIDWNLGVGHAIGALESVL